MKMQKNKTRNGFTLVELMIVVAIIGILASVAIPQFIDYQLTSKRAEAFANLSSLAKAQKGYFAEFGAFVPAEPQPGVGLSNLPGPLKRDMSPVLAEFFEIGWGPEGDVFFDYDTVTAADTLTGGSCDKCRSGACDECGDGCFTAAAYGDLDGNGELSVLIYAHPDTSGAYCTTGFAGRDAPVNKVGVRMLDEAARVLAADRF